MRLSDVFVFSSHAVPLTQRMFVPIRRWTRQKTTDLTAAAEAQVQVWLIILMLLSAIVLWTGGGWSTAQAAQPTTIDPRRSLVVTDKAILSRFPFERVMDQLVEQSGVPGLTSLDLFHQWWDTQNLHPGLGLGRHCDDQVDGGGNPILNDFPYTCRPDPAEGGQTTSNPFDAPDTNPDAYIPIGLFNRFDLAPSAGTHCGEYRIVYAKRSGIADGRERNLLIFEAILPNPQPNQGLAGCKKIVDYWAKLSKENDVEKRANDLEKLYFEGLGNVPPVVHVSHYGDNPQKAGQVRTNQFMQPSTVVWSLREFKLIRTCNGGRCSAMRFIPVTDKVNPFGPLHIPDPNLAHRKAGGYQAHFVTQLRTNKDEASEFPKGLTGGTLKDIQFDVPDAFNTGQSQASGSQENDYLLHFTSLMPPAPTPFNSAIQAELNALGSLLTPEEVVLRAETQSCAGCHQLVSNKPIGGGLTWPASLGFTHVTERTVEVVGGLERFQISPALLKEFIPQRKQIMEDYLNDKLKKPKKPKETLSGRKTH
jgi:hypothetical protein